MYHGRRALALDYIDALFNLPLLLQRRNECAKAADYWRRYLAVKPGEILARRAARVGDGTVPAYYSGSPEYAGTVNVVRLSEGGGVTVTRAPLDIVRRCE